MVIKYHDQKQLKEERSLFWLTVPGNRVHRDGGRKSVSTQAGSWLTTFHPQTGSRDCEQEGGLRLQTFKLDPQQHTSFDKAPPLKGPMTSHSAMN